MDEAPANHRKKKKKNRTIQSRIFNPPVRILLVNVCLKPKMEESGTPWDKSMRLAECIADQGSARILCNKEHSI